MITFKEYQTKNLALDLSLYLTSKALQELRQGHTSALGLVSDQLRTSAVYVKASAAYAKAFVASRAFNGSMPKEYKRKNSLIRRNLSITKASKV